MRRLFFGLLTALVLSLALTSIGCKGGSGGSSVGQHTPTDAYKSLFIAVKKKDSVAIKKVLSKTTIGFMESNSQLHKQTFEKAIENGLTETTFAPALPQLCKERIKDNLAGLEVMNPKTNQWDDLPFILEDGEWKLAVGDVFNGTYTFLPRVCQATPPVTTPAVSGPPQPVPGHIPRPIQDGPGGPTGPMKHGSPAGQLAPQSQPTPSGPAPLPQPPRKP